MADTADSPHRYRVTSSSDDEYRRGVLREKHEVVSDEPKFLPIAGNDDHPAPVDYLVFGLLACQASVLTQCFEKSRIGEFDITAVAEITSMGAVEEHPEEMPDHTANRIDHIDIEIEIRVPERFRSRAARCADVYDQGCVVGQSLRAGVEYTPSTTVETM